MVSRLWRNYSVNDDFRTLPSNVFNTERKVDELRGVVLVVIENLPSIPASPKTKFVRIKIKEDTSEQQTETRMLRVQVPNKALPRSPGFQAYFQRTRYLRLWILANMTEN